MVESLVCGHRVGGTHWSQVSLTSWPSAKLGHQASDGVLRDPTSIEFHSVMKSYEVSF